MEALSYALPAGQAMIQLALFCAVGFAFGVYPRPNGLLDQAALRSMSQQVFLLFTPALMIGVFGSKLSFEAAVQQAGVMLWSIIHAAVNLLVGGVLIPRLVPIERHFRASFTLASTFNNSASVPLLLLSGLCRAPQLAGDPEAYPRAVAAIFIYSLVWNLVFWSGGLWYMKRDAQAQGLLPPEAAAAGGGGGAGDKAKAEDDGAAHEEPSMAAASAATVSSASTAGGYDERPVAGLPPHLERQSSVDDVEAGSSSSGAADVPRSAGAALRPGPTLRRLLDRTPTQASPAGTTSDVVGRRRGAAAAAAASCRGGSAAAVGVAIQKALLTPPVIGIFIGVCVGLLEPLRRALFERGGSLQSVGDVITLLGAPSIPVSNLILAGSLFHGLRDLRRRRAEAKRRAAAAAAAAAAAEAAAGDDEDEGASPAADGAAQSIAASTATGGGGSDDDHAVGERKPALAAAAAAAGTGAYAYDAYATAVPAPWRPRSPSGVATGSGGGGMASAGADIVRSLSRRLSRTSSMRRRAGSYALGADDAAPPGPQPLGAPIPLQLATPAGPVTVLLPADADLAAAAAVTAGASSGGAAQQPGMQQRLPYGWVPVDSQVHADDTASVASAGTSNNGDAILKRTASIVSYISRRLTRGESFSLVALAPPAAAAAAGGASSAATSTITTGAGAPGAPSGAAGVSVIEIAPTATAGAGGSRSRAASRTSSFAVGGGGSGSGAAAAGTGADGGAGGLNVIVRTASAARRTGVAGDAPGGSGSGSAMSRTSSWSITSLDGSASAAGYYGGDDEEGGDDGGVVPALLRSVSGGTRRGRAPNFGAASFIAAAAAGTLAQKAGEQQQQQQQLQQRPVPRLGTLAALREVPSNVDLEALGASAVETDDALPPVPKLPGDEGFDESGHGAAAAGSDAFGIDYVDSDNEEEGSADADGPSGGGIAVGSSEDGGGASSPWAATGAAIGGGRRRPVASLEGGPQPGDSAPPTARGGGAAVNDASTDDPHRVAEAAAATVLLAALASAAQQHHEASGAAAAAADASPGAAAPGAADGDDDPPLSLRTGAALLLTRLVLCPAVLFLLFAAAEAARLPVLAPGRGAQDDVLRLVVLVEAAVPSAQSVLLLCQTTGASRSAKDLSVVYLAMYPASLVTMTVALTAAMAIVFG